MKLFRVEIERTLFVVAEDARAAEIAAEMRYEREESPDYIDAQEVTPMDQLPDDWLRSLPYGAEDNRTVREWIAAIPTEPFIDTKTTDMFTEQ